MISTAMPLRHRLQLLACATFLLLSGSAASHATEGATQSDMKSQRAVSAVRQLSAANNSFGFDLFGRLTASEAQKNVFISPLSLATALQMCYTGAAGATGEALAKALQLQDYTSDELHQSILALREQLAQSQQNGVELTIANALWTRQGIEFKPAFLETNHQCFDAKIGALSFGAPGAVDAINHWVNTSTKGKIPRLVDQLSPELAMILVNAIYFKGEWQEKFDPAKTKDRTFYSTNGGKLKTAMMNRSDRFYYYENDKLQAVRLPYRNGRTNFYLILPRSRDGLNDLLTTLDQESWAGWTRALRSREGSVIFPKFKLGYDGELSNSLKAMGMAPAFDRNRADFSGMRDQRDVYISWVKHKAVVEVNEEGTEASAATGIGIGITSVIEPQKPFELLADHPFFFAIADDRAGAILFMGVFRAPN